MASYRQGKASAAQREQVVRLRAADTSLRKIAEEVFGDARLRGRVERILAAHESASGSVPTAAADAADLQGLSQMEALKVLFERRLAALLADEEPPSMNELHRLLDVQRQLESYELVEEARTLTRQAPAAREDH